MTDERALGKRLNTVQRAKCPAGHPTTMHVHERAVTWTCCGQVKYLPPLQRQGNNGRGGAR